VIQLRFVPTLSHPSVVLVQILQYLA
jgi:hypothetical protein